MDEFNSDDHYIYYCGQESLRRNGVAILVNKRVRNAVLGCNLKNDRMICVHFQVKPFNITVIQVYAPTTNAEGAETERCYEPARPSRTNTPKKKMFFSSQRTGMGEFNSDDHYIYYYGQESLRRNGVAILVNKRVHNAVLGCSLKNNRMISVCFQGKPFSITVIQVYAPTTNAEEA